MCDCKIFISHWYQRSLIKAFLYVMDFFQRKRKKIISFFVRIDVEKGWTCLFLINYHGVSWKFNFWWMFFGKWKDIRKLQRKLKAWFMTKKIFWGTLKYVMAKPTYFCSRIAIFHWINTHLCRKFFVNTEATRVNRKILITGGVNLQEAVSTFKINWFWEGFQF